MESLDESSEGVEQVEEIEEDDDQNILFTPTLYLQMKKLHKNTQHCLLAIFKKHQMIQTVENKQNTKHARLLEFR